MLLKRYYVRYKHYNVSSWHHNYGGYTGQNKCIQLQLLSLTTWIKSDPYILYGGTNTVSNNAVTFLSVIISFFFFNCKILFKKKQYSPEPTNNFALIWHLLTFETDGFQINIVNAFFIETFHFVYSRLQSLKEIHLLTDIF